MNHYNIEGKRINFKAGNSIEFDSPILRSIFFDDSVIVVLDVSVNVICNRNIFAINLNGEIIWQIEKSEKLDLIGDCPFINICIESNKLVAFNWCGFKYSIDPRVGVITDIIFTK